MPYVALASVVKPATLAVSSGLAATWAGTSTLLALMTDVPEYMVPYLSGAGSGAVALWRSVSSMPAQLAFDKLQQCVSVALLAPADLARFRALSRGLTWSMFGTNPEGVMDATGEGGARAVALRAVPATAAVHCCTVMPCCCHW